MISPGCAQKLVDAEISSGVFLQREWKSHRARMKADRAGREHVRVHDSPGGIDRCDSRCGAQRGLSPAAKSKTDLCGCMSQRFSHDCARQLPEVDAFIGLDKSVSREIVEKV